MKIALRCAVVTGAGVVLATVAFPALSPAMASAVSPTAVSRIAVSPTAAPAIVTPTVSASNRRTSPGTNATQADTTAPAVSVAAEPPDFSDDSCSNYTAVGSSFTIADTAGVQYLASGSRKPPGIHPASDGSTLVVLAEALPGYTLTGPSRFTHVFPDTPRCTTTVATAPVTFDNRTCAGGNPATALSYRVPSATGVIYRLGDQVVGAGTYSATAGSVITVTAVPVPGDTLFGTTKWSKIFPVRTDCRTAVRPAAVRFHDDACTATGAHGASYTVPGGRGVIYSVGGRALAAGTYRAADSSTVTVTAQAAHAYRLVGKTRWSHEFSARPRQCSGTRGTNHRRNGDHHGSSDRDHNLAHDGLAATGSAVDSPVLVGISLFLLGLVSHLGGCLRRRVPPHA